MDTTFCIYRLASLLRRRTAGTLPVMFVAIVGWTGAANAADAIQTGPAELDPSTLCCLGFAVPVLDGDDNYNATASVQYREAGSVVWRQGLDMLRVRPETVGVLESPPSRYGLPFPDEEFAGSVFGLEAGVTYEVQITIVDPDGGGSTQTFTAATRAAPVDEPVNPVYVPVTNTAELQAAVSGAQAGHVIEIAAGVYAGPLSIGNSGTTENPVILRGADRETVMIDAGGASSGVNISGSHVYLEHVTVSNSRWGARLTGSDGIVVRHSRFVDVERGIEARFGSRRGFYICDNELQGQHAWPNISNSTWDDEGIVITGEGHVVCHNTLSGFGDALGLNQNTSIRNRSIDFIGNEVLWSGDDGIELDYAHRNVRAIGNRIVNSSSGVSVQPGWGGPIYILRNVLINQSTAPFKLNNDPTGIIMYHNTSVRSDGPRKSEGAGWGQIGYTQSNGDWAYVANFEFWNNVVLGTSQPAKFTSDIVLGRIDFNAWYPDGRFDFQDAYTDLADLQARSPYEANGLILTQPVFEMPPVLGADYQTFVEVAEVDLRVDSGAVDAGRVLANVNDGFAGSAPDMGAWERGMPRPEYGVREIPTEPPLDTDGDGIPDATDTDDDNDGLSDTDETEVYGTDPLHRDTDRDGLDDGLEVQLGLNPRDGSDCPESLCPDNGLMPRLLQMLDTQPAPLS